MLVRLGFTRYEAKVYVALLVRGTATASEISDLSGVPYTRVYDVLGSLESKGFVASIPGRPMKFQAIEPRVAFANFLEVERRRMEEKIRELEKGVHDVLELLSKLPPASGGGEKLVQVRGSTAIASYVRHLASKARRRLYVVSREDVELASSIPLQRVGTGSSAKLVVADDEIVFIVGDEAIALRSREAADLVAELIERVRRVS